MSVITFDDWKNPNTEIVRYFAGAFDIDYHKSEKELIRLFSIFDENEIEHRVRRLNADYHTRLWEDHIACIVDFLKESGLSFENRVKAGEITAVHDLATCGGKNWFVFTTKYCSFVNPNYYPIYDALIAGVLERFQEMNQFYNTEESLNLEKLVRDPCDYELFKGIIGKFMNAYNLQGCSYKELDKFLWLVGKNL